MPRNAKAGEEHTSVPTPPLLSTALNKIAGMVILFMKWAQGATTSGRKNLQLGSWRSLVAVLLGMTHDRIADLP